MPRAQGIDRRQARIVALDDVVGAQSDARLIDAFVESLDLGELGFSEPSAMGRPSYGAARLLKLYVYGYRHGIRSSRKLMRECLVNVEAMWLVDGTEPDFRTIADFRKCNAERLKGVFKAFNDRLSGAVEWGFASVDGSKFRADNSKARNFTASKLDDRIEWGEARVEEYMRVIAEVDAMEEPSEADVVTRESALAGMAAAQELLERYRGYLEALEESGETQLSVTDADARLMRGGSGFVVAYNPQTAVDSNTHIIRDFEMTNAGTDNGQLLPTLEGIAEETDGVLEAVADMGYRSGEDMLACLERGIVPHVICGDGKDSHEIECAYVEADADDLDRSSTDPAELSRCIHAGVVPEAYAHVIEGMEVAEARVRVVDEPDRQDPRDHGTREEMEARAAEGYFVHDAGANRVICPAGEVLRQKETNKSGSVAYANKLACKRCPHKGRCLTGKQPFRRVSFTKDQLEKPCRPWHEAAGTEPDARGVTKGRCHYERRKVVRFRLRPQLQMTRERMALSEHPFGTIKRDMGEGHFLLRGMSKVEGEFALMALGYNIARATNLLGFDRLMGLMAA